MSMGVSLFDVPPLNTKESVIDITKFVTLLFGTEDSAKALLGIQAREDAERTKREKSEKTNKEKMNGLKDKNEMVQASAMDFIEDFVNLESPTTEVVQGFLRNSPHSKNYKKITVTLATMVSETTTSSDNSRFLALMYRYFMQVSILSQQNPARDFNFLSISADEDGIMRVSGEFSKAKIDNNTHAKVMQKKIQGLMNAQRTKEERDKKLNEKKLKFQLQQKEKQRAWAVRKKPAAYRRNTRRKPPQGQNLPVWREEWIEISEPRESDKPEHEVAVDQEFDVRREGNKLSYQVPFHRVTWKRISYESVWNRYDGTYEQKKVYPIESNLADKDELTYEDLEAIMDSEDLRELEKTYPNETLCFQENDTMIFQVREAMRPPHQGLGNKIARYDNKVYRRPGYDVCAVCADRIGWQDPETTRCGYCSIVTCKKCDKLLRCRDGPLPSDHVFCLLTANDVTLSEGSPLNDAIQTFIKEDTVFQTALKQAQPTKQKGVAMGDTIEVSETTLFWKVKFPDMAERARGGQESQYWTQCDPKYCLHGNDMELRTNHKRKHWISKLTNFVQKNVQEENFVENYKCEIELGDGRNKGDKPKMHEWVTIKNGEVEDFYIQYEEYWSCDEPNIFQDQYVPWERFIKYGTGEFQTDGKAPIRSLFDAENKTITFFDGWSKNLLTIAVDDSKETLEMTVQDNERSADELQGLTFKSDEARLQSIFVPRNATIALEQDADEGGTNAASKEIRAGCEWIRSPFPPPKQAKPINENIITKLGADAIKNENSNFVKFYLKAYAAGFSGGDWPRMNQYFKDETDKIWIPVSEIKVAEVKFVRDDLFYFLTQSGTLQDVDFVTTPRHVVVLHPREDFDAPLLTWTNIKDSQWNGRTKIRSNVIDMMFKAKKVSRSTKKIELSQDEWETMIHDDDLAEALADVDRIGFSHYIEFSVQGEKTYWKPSKTSIRSVWAQITDINADNSTMSFNDLETGEEVTNVHQSSYFYVQADNRGTMDNTWLYSEFEGINKWDFTASTGLSHGVRGFSITRPEEEVAPHPSVQFVEHLCSHCYDTLISRNYCHSSEPMVERTHFERLQNLFGKPPDFEGHRYPNHNYLTTSEITHKCKLEDLQVGAVLNDETWRSQMLTAMENEFTDDDDSLKEEFEHDDPVLVYGILKMLHKKYFQLDPDSLLLFSKESEATHTEEDEQEDTEANNDTEVAEAAEFGGYRDSSLISLMQIHFREMFGAETSKCANRWENFCSSRLQYLELLMAKEICNSPKFDSKIEKIETTLQSIMKHDLKFDSTHGLSFYQMLKREGLPEAYQFFFDIKELVSRVQARIPLESVTLHVPLQRVMAYTHNMPSVSIIDILDENFDGDEPDAVIENSVRKILFGHDETNSKIVDDDDDTDSKGADSGNDDDGEEDSSGGEEEEMRDNLQSHFDFSDGLVFEVISTPQKQRTGGGIDPMVAGAEESPVASPENSGNQDTAPENVQPHVPEGSEVLDDDQDDSDIFGYTCEGRLHNDVLITREMIGFLPLPRIQENLDRVLQDCSRTQQNQFKVPVRDFLSCFLDDDTFSRVNVILQRKENVSNEPTLEEETSQSKEGYEISYFISVALQVLEYVVDDLRPFLYDFYVLSENQGESGREYKWEHANKRQFQEIIAMQRCIVDDSWCSESDLNEIEGMNPQLKEKLASAIIAGRESQTPQFPRFFPRDMNNMAGHDIESHHVGESARTFTLGANQEFELLPDNPWRPIDPLDENNRYTVKKNIYDWAGQRVIQETLSDRLETYDIIAERGYDVYEIYEVTSVDEDIVEAIKPEYKDEKTESGEWTFDIDGINSSFIFSPPVVNKQMFVKATETHEKKLEKTGQPVSVTEGSVGIIVKTEADDTRHFPFFYVWWLEEDVVFKYQFQYQSEHTAFSQSGRLMINFNPDSIAIGGNPVGYISDAFALEEGGHMRYSKKDAVDKKTTLTLFVPEETEETNNTIKRTNPYICRAVARVQKVQNGTIDIENFLPPDLYLFVQQCVYEFDKLHAAVGHSNSTRNTATSAKTTLNEFELFKTFMNQQAQQDEAQNTKLHAQCSALLSKYMLESGMAERISGLYDENHLKELFDDFSDKFASSKDEDLIDEMQNNTAVFTAVDQNQCFLAFRQVKCADHQSVNAKVLTKTISDAEEKVTTGEEKVYTERLATGLQSVENEKIMAAFEFEQRKTEFVEEDAFRQIVDPPVATVMFNPDTGHFAPFFLFMMKRVHELSKQEQDIRHVLEIKHKFSHSESDPMLADREIHAPALTEAAIMSKIKAKFELQLKVIKALFCNSGQCTNDPLLKKLLKSFDEGDKKVQGNVIVNVKHRFQEISDLITTRALEVQMQYDNAKRTQNEKAWHDAKSMVIKFLDQVGSIVVSTQVFEAGFLSILDPNVLSTLNAFVEYLTDQAEENQQFYPAYSMAIMQTFDQLSKYIVLKAGSDDMQLFSVEDVYADEMADFWHFFVNALTFFTMIFFEDTYEENFQDSRIAFMKFSDQFRQHEEDDTLDENTQEVNEDVPQGDVQVINNKLKVIASCDKVDLSSRYRTHTILGDGACLFRAIAYCQGPEYQEDTMEGRQRQLEKANELRLLAVEEARTATNPEIEIYSGKEWEFNNMLDEKETWDQYEARMTEWDTWGTNFEVRMLSKALKQNFEVYIKQPHEKHYIRVLDVGNFTGQPIHKLFYNNKDHYDLLLPIDPNAQELKINDEMDAQETIGALRTTVENNDESGGDQKDNQKIALGNDGHAEDLQGGDLGHLADEDEDDGDDGEDVDREEEDGEEEDGEEDEDEESSEDEDARKSAGEDEEEEEAEEGESSGEDDEEEEDKILAEEEEEEEEEDESDAAKLNVSATFKYKKLKTRANWKDGVQPFAEKLLSVVRKILSSNQDSKGDKVSNNRYLRDLHLRIPGDEPNLSDKITRLQLNRDQIHREERIYSPSLLDIYTDLHHALKSEKDTFYHNVQAQRAYDMQITIVQHNFHRRFLADIEDADSLVNFYAIDMTKRVNEFAVYKKKYYHPLLVSFAQFIDLQQEKVERGERKRHGDILFCMCRLKPQEERLRKAIEQEEKSLIGCSVADLKARRKKATSAHVNFNLSWLKFLCDVYQRCFTNLDRGDLLEATPDVDTNKKIMKILFEISGFDTSLMLVNADNSPMLDGSTHNSSIREVFAETSSVISPESPSVTSPESPVELPAESPSVTSPESPAVMSPESPVELPAESPSVTSPESPSVMSPESPGEDMADDQMQALPVTEGRSYVLESRSNDGVPADEQTPGDEENFAVQIPVQPDAPSTPTPPVEDEKSAAKAEKKRQRDVEAIAKNARFRRLPETFVVFMLQPSFMEITSTASIRYLVLCASQNIEVQDDEDEEDM